jgi:hypothetical protein
MENNNNYAEHQILPNQQSGNYGRQKTVFTFGDDAAKRIAASNGMDPSDPSNLAKILELLVKKAIFTSKPNTIIVPFVPDADDKDKSKVDSKKDAQGRLLKQSHDVVDQTYQYLKNDKQQKVPHCIARAIQLLDVTYINSLKPGDTPKTRICKFNIGTLDKHPPLKALAQLYGTVDPLDRVKMKDTSPTAFATSMKVLEAFVGSKGVKPTTTPLTVNELKDSRQFGEMAELQASLNKLKAAFNPNSPSEPTGFGSIEEYKPAACLKGKGDIPLTNPLASKLRNVSQQLLSHHVKTAENIATFLKEIFNLSKRPDGSWQVDGPNVSILFAGFPHLDELTNIARNILVNYYSKCETVYQEGVTMWEAEVKDSANNSTNNSANNSPVNLARQAAVRAARAAVPKAPQAGPDPQAPQAGPPQTPDNIERERRAKVMAARAAPI